MECQHFSNFRNRFLITTLWEIPYILKFKQIMSASQKHTLEKLYKFIGDINTNTNIWLAQTQLQ
jgi:hypothetical protein